MMLIYGFIMSTMLKIGAYAQFWLDKFRDPLYNHSIDSKGAVSFILAALFILSFDNCLNSKYERMFCYG